MRIKKTVAKTIAKASLAVAQKACGAASFYGIYQPKEPVDLLSKLDKMREINTI